MNIIDLGFNSSAATRFSDRNSENRVAAVSITHKM